MIYRTLSGIAAAAALMSTPIAASAAPVSPASAFSPAAPARAASTTDHQSALSGGLFGGGAAIYAIIAVVGIGVILAIGLSRNGNDNPRSP